MEHDDDHSHFFNHERNQYDLKSKIMLTAVLSLSIIVLIIAILHFYTKCTRRRQVRRRAMELERILTATRTSTTEPPKTGLNPLIVASLPTFLIKKFDEMESIMECSICLSSLEENEVARILPNCKHTFHAECIDKWFVSHPNCPICRTEADPRVVLVAEQPTAPPLEGVEYPTVAESMEGTSSLDTSGLLQSSSSGKSAGSNTKFNSFRRILSKEKSSSSRKNQSQSSGEDGTTNNNDMHVVDIERQ